MQKSADAFRTISEVAADLSLPQHVLRFWETRFPQIRPLKRAGGRRYYRPGDVVLLKTIRQLLYDDGYTIKGVQRLLKEQGTKALSANGRAVEVAEADGPLSLVAEISSPTPALSLDDATELFMTEDITTLSGLHRDAIEDAVATLEECKRILDALRRLAP